MPLWLWIALALFIGYFVFFYVKPFGNALAFTCGLLGIPVLALELKIKNVYTHCLDAFRAYPPVEHNVFFSHLLYFLLAVCFLLAEVFNTYLAIPALMHTQPVSAPAGWFEYASSILILTVPAFFGIELLVAVGLVEPKEGLFDNLTIWHRIALALYSLTFFLISVFVIYLFWRFRGIYLDTELRKSLDPMVLPNLALQVIEGLGFLVVGAAPLLFRAIVVGIHPVLKLFLGILCIIIVVVSFLLRVLAFVLNAISLHFAQTSIFDTQATVGLSVAAMSVKSGSGVQVINGSSSTPPLLPAPHTSGSQTPSCSTESGVLDMEKVVGFTFDDHFGTQEITPVKRALESMAGTSSFVLSSGRLGYLNPASPRPGFGEDTSPSSRKGSRREQFAAMAENIIRVHTPVANIPGVLFHSLDCQHGSDCSAMLEPISRRLPAVQQVVITLCSQQDSALPAVQGFYQAVLAVSNTTVLRVDPLSDFAKEQGYPKTCGYIADTEAKLVISQKHSNFNFSPVELVAWLSPHSRCIKLDFALAPVASGKTPLRYLWMKPFTARVVTGSYGDCLKQALFITKAVVPAPSGMPQYLMFSCPFADKRYHRFVQEVNQVVTYEFPGTLTGAVAAGMIPPLNPTAQSPFFVGVSAFTPEVLP